MSLNFDDQRHLTAAEGWLELGNWLEANEELERISPTMRAAPAILRLRWEIYAKAKKWEMASEVGRSLSVLLPHDSWGWIHWAFSLHEMKRTKEAQSVLMTVVNKYPDEYRIPYNLACYACQLGELREALQWLEQAIDCGGKEDIRLMALDDRDLEPLWMQISEI